MSCVHCSLPDGAHAQGCVGETTGPAATSGVPPEVAEALAPEYRAVRLLGRGGMGAVYLALETRLDREVAVKVLVPVEGDPQQADRFAREARVAARLEHPHIIPVYGVGTRGGVHFIAMKYLRGPSLAQVLAERGTLSVAETRRLLADVAEALDYASAQGVVHRDIKPENIMLDERGRAIVVDFGIARAANTTRLTGTRMSIGTPEYMSPEQICAHELDGRSDLYSLGVVGYRCLVGRTPFEGEDGVAVAYQHVHAPAPVPTLDDHEARALYAVIHDLLAKAPADRPASGRALLERLGMPTAGAPVLAATRSTPRTASGGSMPTVTTASPDSGAPQAARQQVSVEFDRLRVESTRAAYVATAGGLRAMRFLLQIARAGMQWATFTAPAAVARGWRAWRSLSPRARAALAGIAAAAVFGIAVATSRRAAAADAERCALADPTRMELLIDAARRIRATGALDVGYALCGAPPSADYTVVAQLASRPDGLGRLFGKKGVTREARDRGSVGRPGRRRELRIDLDGLAPGSYVLTVTVTSGRSSRVRSQTVALVAR